MQLLLTKEILPHYIWISLTAHQFVLKRLSGFVPSSNMIQGAERRTRRGGRPKASAAKLRSFEIGRLASNPRRSPLTP